MAGRPKGQPKTGGRVKGTPNKIDGQLKDAIIQSFYAVGGVDYLVQQARDNPGPYMSLVGKVLPKDINAIVDSNLTIILNKPNCSTLLDK